MSVHYALTTIGKNVVRGFRRAYNRKLNQGEAVPAGGGGGGSSQPKRFTLRRLEGPRSEQSGRRSFTTIPRPGSNRSTSLSTLPASPFQAFTQGGFSFASAHRFLVNSVLRRVTNSQASVLRRKTAQQLLAGRSAPFLALVGVSLASGDGLITKEDEIECVCSEIRHAAGKIQWPKGNHDEFSALISHREQRNQENDSDEEEVERKAPTVSLLDFQIGKAIAKGCHAAVYAARWTKERAREISSGFERIEGLQEVCERPEEDDGESSERDVQAGNEEAAENDMAESVVRETLAKVTLEIDAEEIGIADGAPDSAVEGKKEAFESKQDDEVFPFAIKMMFNYEAESNSMAILNVMHRETLPARFLFTSDAIAEWSQNLQSRKKRLPPHPNIVEMHAVFTDFVPDIKDSMQLYPDALPRRLNPDGYGRNMSLFLVMKNYDTSLKDYLKEYQGQVSSRTSLLILAQLLEGIAHMTNQRIAHRDLKTDNLLLDLSASGSKDFPRLVITDFGCCLADERNGLKLPFNSYDMTRGGNSALMAPEVATATPGTFSSIDYSKADVWAGGAIAYEIFGQVNPFYATNGKKRMDSRVYRSRDLPSLPESVPEIYNCLIRDMLRRKPGNRLSAEEAATICQLLLWAPSGWYKNSQRNTGKQEILQWLLTLTTKILCESRFSNSGQALNEYQLVATFLARLNLSTVKRALAWIKSNY